MATKTINIDNIDFLLMDAVTGPREDFLKNFMEAYSFPKATYKKLITNGTDKDEYYSVKQKMLYKELPKNADMEQAYFAAIQHAKAKERFVIINNFDRFMAKDMVSDKGIDVPFDELADSYEFFLPWTGREITDTLVENPADVKAAAKMGHLFESIIKDNKDMETEALNVFLTRILFCYFADDTGIFEKEQFMNSVINNTNEDGSDLGEYLTRLFAVLDMKENERADINACFKHFPYVNGGLFREHYQVPRFTRASRKKLIEGGTLDWATINPDIFGSMFQTVIDPEQRRHLGQHYTSVPNIMKVLNPLFLDDLHAELDKIGELPSSPNRDKKLAKFREKLSHIKLFDPACGSGNFCIVGYKELCHLEMEAISMYFETELPFLNIRLDHFYGIEIDDFPCEVARLSLWLAQHQINMECYQKFGNSNPTLPLTASGHIVCGNALRLDWTTICHVSPDDIIYIASNPPYVGRNLLEPAQKNEVNQIMKDCPNCGYLDYVWCWLKLASIYIENAKCEKCRAAMVTTNSVSQGVQVSAWKTIFKHGCDISFVHKSFLWDNNASNKAGVIVSIVGLKTIADYCDKYIYDDNTQLAVKHINPYFANSSSDAIVVKSSHIPFDLKMTFGSMANDKGSLTSFSDEEISKLLTEVPGILKRFYGAEEYINGKTRYCLWITEENLKEAMSSDIIKSRIDNVRKHRSNSNRKETIKLAETPWAFGEIHFKENKPAIIIPRVSSINRNYIPIGYLPENSVIADSAFAIYDAPIWLFAILTSNMHMVWMRNIGGKLKNDYRYSNTLCYNTFPFPSLTEKQKAKLEDSAMSIIEAREAHYDMTNAELYNDATMPDDLKAAHEANDLLVDSLYKGTGFKNDEERLAELFKRYEQMIKEAK